MECCVPESVGEFRLFKHVTARTSAAMGGVSTVTGNASKVHSGYPGYQFGDRGLLPERMGLTAGRVDRHTFIQWAKGYTLM